MRLNESMPEERDPMLSELPANFTKQLGAYYYMKTSNESVYKHDLRKAVNDLLDMADGGDAYGVRQQYYPDWTDDHFKLLLKKLDIDF